jgi:hypothetical protein
MMVTGNRNPQAYGHFVPAGSVEQRSPDLGGKLGTDEMASAIIAAL